MFKCACFRWNNVHSYCSAPPAPDQKQAHRECIESSDAAMSPFCRGDKHPSPLPSQRSSMTHLLLVLSPFLLCRRPVHSTYPTHTDRCTRSTTKVLSPSVTLFRFVVLGLFCWGGARGEGDCFKQQKRLLLLRQKSPLTDWVVECWQNGHVTRHDE